MRAFSFHWSSRHEKGKLLKMPLKKGGGGGDTYLASRCSEKTKTLASTSRENMMGGVWFADGAVEKDPSPPLSGEQHWGVCWTEGR